ncbi:hypothetical protein [Sorangium sp. So ce128]|uniref:hypothetical protein n=1 Tax=Sorangium sp. So ce128 TaxID=3133281 RepID=UPI003F5DFEFD
MKIRARWLGLELSGVPLRRLADGMAKAEYTRRRPTGFRVDEVRREHLAGRFIERIEWDDTVEDPAGGSLTVHRVELRQVNFRIQSATPELQIADPPRSLRSFFDHLSQCADTPVVAREVTVTPMAWLEEIEKGAGHATVLAATATGLTLSASTLATVSVVGTDDVRENLRRFTSGRNVDIERLLVQLPPPLVGRCELFPAGRAMIIDGDTRAMGLLRDALQVRVGRSVQSV